MIGMLEVTEIAITEICAAVLFLKAIRIKVQRTGNKIIFINCKSMALVAAHHRHDFDETPQAFISLTCQSSI